MTVDYNCKHLDKSTPKLICKASKSGKKCKMSTCIFKNKTGVGIFFIRPR